MEMESCRTPWLAHKTQPRAGRENVSTRLVATEVNALAADFRGTLGNAISHTATGAICHDMKLRAWPATHPFSEVPLDVLLQPCSGAKPRKDTHESCRIITYVVRCSVHHPL
jgi:hypothetical protein